jgi:malate dehydrogenase (oxaloacetate-decarboxylating)(NADP+)
LSDTAINIDPSADDLAKIAYDCKKQLECWSRASNCNGFCFQFWLVYQSKSIKSKRSCSFARASPDLIIDGEVQADFALNPEMLKEKFFSKLAGKKVNTLIFS